MSGGVEKQKIRSLPAAIPLSPAAEGDEDDADKNEAAEEEHEDDEAGIGVDDLNICGRFVE